jgi:hypothetical protein
VAVGVAAAVNKEAQDARWYVHKQVSHQHCNRTTPSHQTAELNN